MEINKRQIDGMTYDEKKEKILNALIEREGIQHIVDIASLVMGNPLFVYDVSGKILVKSQNPEDEEVWKQIVPKGHLIFDNYLEVEAAGIYKQLLKDDKAVWGTFAFCPYRFLGCRIQDKKGSVGITTMVEVHKSTQENQDLLVVVCKAILFEMLYRERTVMQEVPYYEVLKDLLESSAGRESVDERAKVLHLHFPGRMMLIGLYHQAVTEGLPAYFVRESILAAVPGCYSIIYENYLLVLIESTGWNEKSKDAILACCPDKNAKINISSPFCDKWELSKAFEQVKAIQKLRTKLNLSEQFIMYDDVRIYHFFELVRKEMLEEFCMPVVGQMEAYDIEHNTLFAEAVECYLECGRNMQRAAEFLHWHKNTLYYRLKKVEELFDLDFENENLCFQLQVSFRMKKILFV